MQSIRKDELIWEKAMELATFRPMCGGDIIQRKERAKALGCSRAASNLP